MAVHVHEIIIYGTTWCGDCKRALGYLNSRRISYRYVNIEEDPQAEAFVMAVNNGYQSVPTIVFPDGTLLVEPSVRELAQKLAVLLPPDPQSTGFEV